MKSGAVLIFIITLFFLQSFPELQKLSIGWCALIGVILLLIIAEKYRTEYRTVNVIEGNHFNFFK